MSAGPVMLASGRLANAEGLSIANDPRQIALVESLAFAVPLWMWELRGFTDSQRAARGRRCAGIVAERGDVLQFDGSRKGKAAAVFNAFAEGLACAAYQPGGVTFAGRHWCVDHTACLDAAEAAADALDTATVEGDAQPPGVTLPRQVEGVALSAVAVEALGIPAAPVEA